MRDRRPERRLTPTAQAFEAPKAPESLRGGGSSPTTQLPPRNRSIRAVRALMRAIPFTPSESELGLRVVVTDIERELSCLGRTASAAEHQSALDDLTASWARLGELLGFAQW
jgi:hypothetical protein